ncbi:MAG: fasciclin domain-containing protein [Bacteroidota bacterium]
MKKFFKKRNLIFQIAVVTALTLTISSCEKEALAPGADDADFKRGRAKAAPAPEALSITGTALAVNAETGEFDELIAALSYAGLVEFFDGTDQYTVFAPNDVAFENLYAALGVGTGDDRFSNIDVALGEGTVMNVLKYHVTEGRRASNSVVPRVGARTIETLLDGATFDVKPDLSIEAIGNTAKIESADISASNGIIHVIDAVILPIGGDDPGTPEIPENSIAGIAIEAGFSELVNALAFVDAELETGLVELFATGNDQYTVFAPTNEAFEALYKALGVSGIGNGEGELSDAGLVLNVLLYHVTEGRRASNSVVPPVKPRTIETLLEGSTFSVFPNLSIEAISNEANITGADIFASNGVIHIIDTVLLPAL